MTRRYLEPEEQGRFTGDRLAAVRKIAKIADHEACDFVVVCGDVFESNQVDRKVVANAVEALKEFSIPVLILPGNHDALDATSVYLSEEFARRPENVILLDTAAAFSVPGSNARVIAAPLTSRTPTEDLAAAALDGLEREGDAPLQVLAAHGVTSDLNPDRNALDTIEINTLVQALEANTIDYVALGDRHSEISVAGDSRIRYSGSPVATSFDDTNSNQILIVEKEGDTIKVEPKKVGEWEFFANSFELAGDEDIDQIESWLDSIPNKHLCVVKFSVIGTVSLAGRVRLDELLDRYAELFAALWLRERHTAISVSPSPEDLEDLSLSGYASTTLEELVELSGTTNDSDAATAGDALSLLYRLAGSA